MESQPNIQAQDSTRHGGPSISDAAALLQNAPSAEVSETQRNGAPEKSEPTELEKLQRQYEERMADLTGKFDSISRRERALLQKEAQLREQAQKTEDFENLRALAKKDPASVMEKLGLSYEQLTDFFANQTPEDETTKTIGSLKSEIEELKKQREIEKQEGQMKEIAKVKSAKLDALKNLANKDDSDYGLIAGFGSYEDVIEHMSQHYQATGEILDDHTAMQAVENQLAENLKELAKNSKVRQLLGVQIAQPEDSKEEVPPVTLSNNSFGSEAPKTESTRGLSESQLFELALAKLPSLSK